MLQPHHYLIMFMAVLTLMLLRGRRQFDDVLAAMHRDHRELWDAAGMPLGFFWMPDDRSGDILDGVRARKVIFRTYMRIVPDWLEGNEPLLLKLFWARIYLSLSYIGFVATGIVLLVIQLT